MIERIIENWLDKASEKAFQIPFCYMLINQGHTIIHMTRHCGMEHGKDIISRDKNGEICAYQLKGAPGSKIKLRDWQQEIQGQIIQLVCTPVTHPSVTAGTHKSFFVTNGGIEEEVSHAIMAMNQQWSTLPFLYHVDTYVGGELKDMAKKLGNAFLPADIKDFKSLLEFLLEDGSGCLDKEKLVNLITSVLTDEKVSTQKIKERMNSAALLTSIALSNYINSKNHFVVYEGWIIYLSSLLGYGAKHKLSSNKYENEYDIGEQLAINALEDLWDELKDRRNLLGNNPLEDTFFYPAQRLLNIGLMSNLGLYYLLNDLDFKHAVLQKFILSHLEEISIWGESALPHILSCYWYLRTTGAEKDALELLKKTLGGIVDASLNEEGLIGPYYSVDDCLNELYNHNEKIVGDRYQSNFIESFINLLTLHDCKEELIAHWPAISHFKFLSFGLARPSDFFTWRNSSGKEILYLPKFPEDWAELKQASNECSGDGLPDSIKKKPILFPLLLSVMPQRGNAEFTRWFNEKIKVINLIGNVKSRHLATGIE